MAAASQLACRAGPTIYITLAFHRSPLTRHCLGPRLGGPTIPRATTGTVTACEGQDSSVSQPPPCQLLRRKEKATWAGNSFRGEKAELDL
jgi:hypothetical protein